MPHRDSRPAWRPSARAALLSGLAGVTACSGDCVVPPCALPAAVRVTVRSTTNMAVPGAEVGQVGAGGSIPCVTTCVVPGAAGEYRLTIRAPGFQQVEESVTVAGSDGGQCGCPTVETQDVEVTLVPG